MVSKCFPKRSAFVPSTFNEFYHQQIECKKCLLKELIVLHRFVPRISVMSSGVGVQKRPPRT